MRMRFIIFSVLFLKILWKIYYGYVPEFLPASLPKIPGGTNPKILSDDSRKLFRNFYGNFPGDYM